MTSDALILIGRRTTGAQQPLETHADRLRSRDVVDTVHTATYESEPVRELRDQFGAIDADRVFAVPMAAAHSYATLDDLPAALGAVPGTVHLAEPIGTSPLVTEALATRAADEVSPDGDVSVALVALGSSSKPYYRQTAEYHAARIEEGWGYDEVRTCFLVQNPTAECVRYNLSNERAVAVPLFLAPGEATSERISAALELDRGGIAYADPLGEHERVTEAVHAAVEEQRVVADREGAAASLDATTDSQPAATDGEGPVR